MKKALSIGAVAALALSLAACSTAPESGSTDSSVTFISPWPKNESTAILDKFAAAHPQIDVKVTYRGTDANATITQLAAGNAPDVLFANPGSGDAMSIGNLAKAGYLVNLDDRPWASEIPETFKSQLTYEDEVYGFPATIQVLGGFYNSETLKSTGLAAPTTWPELLDYCGAASAAGVSGYMLPGQTEWMVQLIPLALAATVLDDASATESFDTEGWEQVFARYQEMIDGGCFEADASGVNGDVATELMTQGKAGSIVTVSAATSGFIDASGEGVYSYEAIPATENADDTRLTVMLSTSVGINAKAKNPEAAGTLVDWLASPEGLSAVAESQFGSVPAIPNAEFPTPTFLSVLADYEADGRTSPEPGMAWSNPEVRSALIAGAQAMLLGSMSGADVVTSMEDAFNKK